MTQRGGLAALLCAEKQRLSSSLSSIALVFVAGIPSVVNHCGTCLASVFAFCVFCHISVFCFLSLCRVFSSLLLFLFHASAVCLVVSPSSALAASGCLFSSFLSALSFFNKPSSDCVAHSRVWERRRSGQTESTAKTTEEKGLH